MRTYSSLPKVRKEKKVSVKRWEDKQGSKSCVQITLLGKDTLFIKISWMVWVKLCFILQIHAELQPTVNSEYSCSWRRVQPGSLSCRLTFWVRIQLWDCFSYICKISPWNFYWDCTAFVDCFRHNGHFYSINSSNPWARKFFTISSVFLSFFL